MRACALGENFWSDWGSPAMENKRIIRVIRRRIRGTGLGLTYGIVRAAKGKHKMWDWAEIGEEGVVGINRAYTLRLKTIDILNG